MDCDSRAEKKELQRASDRHEIESGKKSAREVYERNAHFVILGMRPRLDLAERQS